MADFAWLVVPVIVVIVWALRRLRRPDPPPPVEVIAPVVPATTSAAPAFTTPEAAAETIRSEYDDAVHPRDLPGNAGFKRGVELYCDARRYGALDLMEAVRGADPVLGCMALEALSRRPDVADAAEPLIEALPSFATWYRFFALRALAVVEAPILGAVLGRLYGGWSWTEAISLPSLRDFVTSRTARGDQAPLGDRLNTLSREQRDAVIQTIEAIADVVPPSLLQEFRDGQARNVDVDALKKIGKMWGDQDYGHNVFLADTAPAVVAEMATALRTGRGGLVLLGEPGVGKTSLIRVLARRLRADGWHFFEATAADLLAGQTYIGQLEGRVQELVRAVAGKRVVWVVPNVHELLWAGTHRLSPTGVLDLVLPHVERGDLRLLGETTPSAFVRLTEARPAARTTLRTYRMEALDEAGTLRLARDWAGRHARAALGDEALREALQLVRQYLSDKAMPGNLLHLLELTRARLAEGRPGPLPSLTLDDLRLTLSRLTGLPVSILDDRAELNLAALRALFERRVIGQAEAVDCLVERVAMIKAGLTDSSRPQGVFMFVGPTGTGKTEIAKTLAEFLFGAADRMIRLDMSEFQTGDALDRLLGTTDLAGGHALVDLVRRQPFSVILLDEFEKANPYVWNLFLQLFDDGRLTDRRGVTADFRHCIVIMTSNLGAAVPSGPGLGFAAEAPRFASSTVERALGQVFRPEFVNRIDRIVVFRPLDRAVMRRILRKELDDVLNRRGLRSRTWAVEWDESAVDFLLEKGFTPDLGARPLKRAIERYLLSPLALTIVNRQVPAGDQFLFVRSDGEKIDVAFVDPDAPEPEAAPPPPPSPPAEAAALRIEEIVLDPRGVRAEVAALDAAYRRVAARLQSAEWQAQKAAAFEETRAPGFWESPARFGVLGRAEYLDRFESGLEAAGSLLRRLRGNRPQDRERLPRDIVQRLAQLLFLMETACEALAKGRPRDAFLSVTAGRDPGGDPGMSDRFARRLGAMYTEWARIRRMRFEVLEEVGDGTTPYRLLLAVSGFAAFPILEGESGLHVRESLQEPRSFQRAHARVTVAAQPDEPAAGADGLRAQARAALAPEAGSTPAVVRSYREEPSPLVRDRVHQWRTGRLDRVLAGNFDVM